MRYWTSGALIARSDKGDPTIICEAFHWSRSEWLPAPEIGSQIQFSGDWREISEQEAESLIARRYART